MIPCSEAASPKLVPKPRYILTRALGGVQLQPARPIFIKSLCIPYYFLMLQALV